jgi:hypothetical protein
MLPFRSLIAIGILWGALAAPAAADPIANATLGVTLDPVLGQHVEPAA